MSNHVPVWLLLGIDQNEQEPLLRHVVPRARHFDDVDVGRDKVNMGEVQCNNGVEVWDLKSLRECWCEVGDERGCEKMEKRTKGKI